MRINLNKAESNYQLDKDGILREFILLGKFNNKEDERIQQKIERKISDEIDGFWGTLGRSDNNKLKWSGHIKCSKYGNQESTGLVAKEIELLKEIHPHLKDSSDKVTERYINLDYVDFDDFPSKVDVDDIPELRLEVFLKKDQGAEVFLQEYTADGRDALIEHVLCESTIGTETNKRDRLTYNIPIIPNKMLRELGDTGIVETTDTSHNTRFVIKILIFNREPANNSPALLDGVIKRLIDKPFKVVKYDKITNKFNQIDDMSGINGDQKTLLVIHGTISTIDKSFDGLLNQKYKEYDSWFQYLLNQDHYKQIIGINHDTLTKSAEENADDFIHFIGHENIFKQEVSILGTSRGGLVLRVLCSKYSHILRVDKAIPIAMANYGSLSKVGERASLF